MKTTKRFLAFAGCTILFAGCTILFAGCKEDEPKDYTINVTFGANGTASSDKTTAKEGATIELTATPNPGYSFDKWTVESGGVTCMPDESANPATFTMPAANVSIKAEFIQGIVINGVRWAYTNVDAPGTFAAKPEDSGMFYQWNRRTGWSSTDPRTSSPAGKTWDISNIAGDEWATANDPCPEGWRVPTRDEYLALCDEGKTTYEFTDSNQVNGLLFTDNISGNSVFFPASGYRDGGVNGSLSNVGQHGRYWSGWAYTDGRCCNMYYQNNGSIYADYLSIRTCGFSVRCVLK